MSLILVSSNPEDRTILFFSIRPSRRAYADKFSNPGTIPSTTLKGHVRASHAIAGLEAGTVNDEMMDQELQGGLCCADGWIVGRSRYTCLDGWPPEHNRPLPVSSESNRAMTLELRCFTGIGGLIGSLRPPCGIARRYNCVLRSDVTTAQDHGHNKKFSRASDEYRETN
jgi:hypothetical protein